MSTAESPRNQTSKSKSKSKNGSVKNLLDKNKQNFVFKYIQNNDFDKNHPYTPPNNWEKVDKTYLTQETIKILFDKCGGEIDSIYFNKNILKRDVIVFHNCALKMRNHNPLLTHYCRLRRRFECAKV